MTGRSAGKMQPRGWCALVCALVPMLGACSSGTSADAGDPTPGGGSSGSAAGGGSPAGGSPAGGSSGSVAGGGMAGGGAAEGGAPGGGSADGCPEVVPLRNPEGSVLELTFAPLLGGAPVVVGEPSAVPGGQVTPTNARFYVSEVELLTADSAPVPVDLVTATGSAAPYGIQLVDWEEPASAIIRLLAPPGTYSGARFTFGINDACNAGGPSRKAPLSASSQMVWPHVAGFLFFRYEALWSADDPMAAAPPNMIHMGGTVGSIFAPRATVTGDFTVLTSGSRGLTINVSFDEIFRGAATEGEVSGIPFPTPEVIAGEHLRRAVPSLGIFTLEGP